MATEDRVKVLEGEFKLIKSELRQTLGSVRDFMLDLKLPPVQEDVNKKTADALAAANQDSAKQGEENQGDAADDYGNESGSGNNGGSNGNMGEDSTFPEPSPDFSSEGQQETASQGTPLESSEPMSESEVEQPLDFVDSDTGEESGISSGEMPGQPEVNQDQNSQDAKGPVKMEEAKPTTPPVNLLANLIRWVSAAKKDIGISQLPVFLDVYASTGNLNTEMKDIILHLAEVATGPEENLLPEKNRTVSEELTICMEINGLSGQLPEDLKRKIQRLTQIILEQSLNAGKSDIWSQMLLELHGVLSGFGNSLKPYQILQAEALAAEEEAAAEKAEDEEESCLDLGEEEDSESEEIEQDILCLDDSRSRNLNLTKPAKLRLIMPVGDGTEQELDLGNLFIATDKKAKDSKLEVKSGISKKKVASRGKAWL